MSVRQVILASHGKLAEGLLNSLRMIVGEDLTQGVETYCLFPGENANDYRNRLKQRILANQNHEYVILCDIKGGSVHMALSQLCVHHNVKVFSGMNMNLAMDILLSAQDVIDVQRKDELLTNARNGITFLAADDLVADDDDEF